MSRTFQEACELIDFIGPNEIHKDIFRRAINRELDGEYKIKYLHNLFCICRMSYFPIPGIDLNIIQHLTDLWYDNKLETFDEIKAAYDKEYENRCKTGEYTFRSFDDDMKEWCRKVFSLDNEKTV